MSEQIELADRVPEVRRRLERLQRLQAPFQEQPLEVSKLVFRDVPLLLDEIDQLRERLASYSGGGGGGGGG